IELRSVDYASAILSRMHDRGYAADAATLNILLRGASLLRMNDVVEALAAIIQQVIVEGRCHESMKELRPLSLLHLMRDGELQG
ncbi:hypothetical protein DL93DRAFT_2079514, partial [Clavulina sp. PMI_390]